MMATSLAVQQRSASKRLYAFQARQCILQLHSDNNRAINAERNTMKTLSSEAASFVQQPRYFHNDICFTRVLQRCIVFQDRLIEASLNVSVASATPTPGSTSGKSSWVKLSQRKRNHLAKCESKRLEVPTWMTLPSWCGLSQSIHTTRWFGRGNTDLAASSKIRFSTFSSRSL